MAEVTGRSAFPAGASKLSPRPSWWWIRASLLRMMESCHLQGTGGHSPDHLGDSGAFLPGVRIGGKSVIDSGICSSMGGSYQRTQCHLSLLKSLFYWFLLKRCSSLTEHHRPVQTSRPHLDTEGSTKARISEGLFHCVHLSLWPKPPLTDLYPHHPC